MITISAVTLTFIGLTLAFGSALVSGAIVWGAMKQKVDDLVVAVNILTASVNDLKTGHKVLEERVRHSETPTGRNHAS